MATTTAYLGELFASTLLVKTAGAEERVVQRLREHNRRRNAAAIRDHVGRESLNAFNVATVEVAIGIMLLVAAPAMRRGEFTVGDLVLFTTYLDALSGLPRRIGRLLAFRRHANVAVERMQRLVGQQPTVLPSIADVSQPHDSVPTIEAPARRVDGVAPPVRRWVTVRYPSSGRGVTPSTLCSTPDPSP
jgi:ATP-binding cassette subfamily B protein